MKDIRMRILSIATTAALVATTAGVASIATVANAQVGGPTVTLSSSISGSTASSTIPVTATFSEAVTGFAGSDVSVTNGTASNFSGSGGTYTFNVTPTTQGTVTVQVPADVASSSASSTGNQASNMLSFTYDVTAPTISNVSVTGITSSCATVNFTTNESATGSISYGTTTAYGSATSTAAGTTNAGVICGLNASTTYNYKITATDAAGNVASTTNATFTTLASVAAPVISNIGVTVNGTSSATITWTTNLPATGNVSYGTTTSYGASTTLETTASTTHSATITGLNEGTVYHYQISATNAGGTTTSTDATFNTNSTASSTPLALVSVQAVRSTAIADGTFDNGFKWILTFTVPTNETNLQMRFTDFSNGSSTIPAANNIRIYSTQSSNASSTGSAIISTNNSYGTILNLTGDSDTSLPGRQVQVAVEVKVPFGTPAGSNYTTTYGAKTSVPTP